MSSATFDVRVIGSGPDGWITAEDWSDVQTETCESCGFYPLLPVYIRDDSHLWPDGPERRAWWEPLTDGGSGEHTPQRCREARA